MKRKLVLALGILVVLVGTPSRSPAMGFCLPSSITLREQVAQADIVLYGTLTNPHQTGDFSEGTTDLQIEAVIKKHEILKDAKVITLTRYVPVTKDSKDKFLVFCDVFKGKIDPYYGVPVSADSDMLKYLKGALESKNAKEVGIRLRYYFDYLDNHDKEISNDAHKEFANAAYQDYHQVAARLPAEKIIGWLKDPKTPIPRYGLYASMLGHCGKDTDAKLLRDLLDDPQKRGSSGVDGILAGYTMLKPKEGWAYIHGLMKDANQDFLVRYQALRATRFLWDYRTDLVDKKELVTGVCELLNDANMADLAIDDLRKWGRSEVAAQVLALYGKPGYGIPIMRRSILSYALSFPQVAGAAEFVKEQRKRDPQRVADAEAYLKLETPPPVPK